jgi:glycosyltransferase involved in cell wall biosynthesis
MRIIHVTEQIDYEWGGLTYVVPRLCRELERRHHEVYLACLSDLPEPTPFSFVRRFTHTLLPIRRQLGANNSMLGWMRRQALTGNITAFHVHGMWRMPTVYPTSVGQEASVPVLFAPHGSLGTAAFRGGSCAKRVFWPMVQRPAMRRATCFHATAESEANEIRSHGFRQPIAVIPNGVDVPARVVGVSKHPRTALCLGRIHPKKAIDVLLHAWQSVEQRWPDWRLRIVGPDDGGHLPGLQALERSLGLRSVSWEGPLEGRAKLEAYAQASVFVMPTWNENFGLTVAESLAARTPALVSKGAPWSALDRERCGWWIDCGVESFEAGLARAIACSDDELAAMGERGRAWISAEFGWSAVASQAEALYEWLGEGQPESRRPTWVIPGTGR